MMAPTYWDFAWMAIGLVSGFAIGRWPTYRRDKSSWIEPTTHDIGLLPGGQVIHHSTCWCKTGDPNARS